MKLDLLTNATVVDGAIKFVNNNSKNRAAVIIKQDQDKDKADVVVHDLEPNLKKTERMAKKDLCTVINYQINRNICRAIVIKAYGISQLMYSY